MRIAREIDLLLIGIRFPSFRGEDGTLLTFNATFCTLKILGGAHELAHEPLPQGLQAAASPPPAASFRGRWRERRWREVEGAPSVMQIHYESSMSSQRYCVFEFEVLRAPLTHECRKRKTLRPQS